MKRLLVTILLIILLAASVITVIALYISGPNLKYEHDIQDEIAYIKETHDVSLQSIERHVFRYVVYVGVTQDSYYWFDREGTLLLQKPKSEIHIEEARTMAQSIHGLDDLQESIGYGYDSGAYVFENDEYLLLMDIDTMEEISYQRK